MNFAPFQTTVLRVRCRAQNLAAVPFLLLAIGWWAVLSSGSAESQQQATLRERLVYGLLAKIPRELAFIDLVVLKVETGKLPERLVNQTFFWARERASPSENGRPQRPIIYFEPAMKARAKRIGVEL